MRYAGLKVLLLRRTMPELRNNHIIPLMSELYGYARYNADQRAFIFPNGSRFMMGYCDNEGDLLQYQGQEFDCIIFEEATPEFRNAPDLFDDRAWTHVIKPFEPPAAWPVWRSFDFGYSKPFSCAWWTVDYDGRLYRILELYGCVPEEPDKGVKWSPDEIFREIHRIETEHRWLKDRHIQGVADPAIWEASNGVSIAETAEKHGVYFEPGDHKRLPGWMQMHYRMQFDEQGIPMMYIFSCCKAFIRTIPLLVYDEHRPEDIDTKQEDHVADESRYLCMANPMKPMKVNERRPQVFDPLSTDEQERDRYAFYRKY